MFSFIVKFTYNYVIADDAVSWQYTLLYKLTLLGQLLQEVVKAQFQ